MFFYSQIICLSALGVFFLYKTIFAKLKFLKRNEPVLSLLCLAHLAITSLQLALRAGFWRDGSL